MTQQSRNLSFTCVFELMRFLIDDRESKFSAAFDYVFRSEGMTIIHKPVRAPQANAYAERVVRTVRADCLDWLLILAAATSNGCCASTTHYNSERLHRGLALEPPDPASTIRPPAGKIERRDRLGGLIHEYYRAPQREPGF